MASTSAPTRQDAAADQAPGSGPVRPPRSTLQEKIDLLFEEIRAPGGRKYTYQEISERAGEKGHTISASWLQALHRDPARKPKVKALEAIAAGFGVPVAYFVDDAIAAQIEPRLALLAALDRPEVAEILNMLLRASPETLRAFKPMLERALEFDGLGTGGTASTPG